MSSDSAGAELPSTLLSSPLPSGLVDPAGRWSSANDALHAVLGAPPPGLAELLDEPGLTASELLADDAPRTVRVQLPLGVDATAVIAGSTADGRRLVQLVDRTDLRRLERLVEAAATATATFVSRVSHDLRNPIGTAQGYTELLLEDPTLGDESRGFVERIASSMRRALDMVTEIVDETRGSAAVAAPHTIELAELVEDVRTELADLLAERGAVLTTAGPLPQVRADRADLRLALSALVRNSVEHHPASARVDVSASLTPAGWAIVVDDDGPGPPATEPATGLGLRLARSAVARRGGSLELEPRDGGGTRARLSLPQRRIGDPPPPGT